AFQTEKEPFSRKRIRQAVAAALDPGVIGVALERAAVPLQSFLPFGVWARREGSPLLGGSRDTVKKLLAEGGWPSGYKSTLVAVGDSNGINVNKLAETLALILGAADIPVTVRLDAAAGAPTAFLKADYDLALAEAPV